jgi:hypothetical protein
MVAHQACCKASHVYACSLKSFISCVGCQASPWQFAATIITEQFRMAEMNTVVASPQDRVTALERPTAPAEVLLNIAKMPGAARVP